MSELKYEVFVDSYTWRTWKSITSHDPNKWTKEQQEADENIRLLERAAENYCEYKYGAIRRIGCYCCYGDGPNLELRHEEIKDESGFEELNSAVIQCYIDFNFEASDYR